MKNNIFSLRRVGLLLRRDLVQNWKLYALVFVAMFACAILLYHFSYMVGIKPSKQYAPYETPSGLNTLINALWTFPGIAMFVFPLITFRFKNKGDIIFQLTTPASSLEKFVARYLLVIVGGMAMVFFAIFLADAATCAACTVLGWPFNKGWTMQFMFRAYSFPPFWHTFIQNVWPIFLLNAVGITLTLIWQRHGLLKAFALIFACITLDVLLFYGTSLSVFRPLFFIPFKTWCCWLFAIVATALAYWLYAHKVVQRRRIF